jgi:hypothetical protein
MPIPWLLSSTARSRPFQCATEHLLAINLIAFYAYSTKAGILFGTYFLLKFEVLGQSRPTQSHRFGDGFRRFFSSAQFQLHLRQIVPAVSKVGVSLYGSPVGSACGG